MRKKNFISPPEQNGQVPMGMGFPVLPAAGVNPPAREGQEDSRTENTCEGGSREEKESEDDGMVRRYTAPRRILFENRIPRSCRPASADGHSSLHSSAPDGAKGAAGRPVPAHPTSTGSTVSVGCHRTPIDRQADEGYRGKGTLPTPTGRGNGIYSWFVEPILSCRGEEPTGMRKDVSHPGEKISHDGKKTSCTGGDAPGDRRLREEREEWQKEKETVKAEGDAKGGERRREDNPPPLIETGNNIRCITIIGQIEGHYLLADNQKTTKYEHVLPALVAVEEDMSAEGLLILLNTVGGDVEAGLAIAELIASMRKPTVSLVLGGGHSIGVPLAVSARRSFIVPSATMTVHPVRINGTVIGAPQTYFWLEQVQQRIVNFVAAHSHISAERLGELMMVPDKIATDIGTILDGRQAVQEGLIDQVGGLRDATAALKEMIAREKGLCTGESGR